MDTKTKTPVKTFAKNWNATFKAIAAGSSLIITEPYLRVYAAVYRYNNLKWTTKLRITRHKQGAEVFHPLNLKP